MAQPKITMPSSGAGLTRYFDESSSKLTFSPGQVIVLAVIVAIVVILLNVYGSRLLGI
jgi:preprotein translocase subunit Sec61beta